MSDHQLNARQDDQALTSDSETESLEVTRSLSAARKQYAASSRETAKHVVAANLAKAKQAVVLRQQRQVPLSDFTPMSAAGREVLPVHLHNTMLGVNRTIPAEEMPLVEPLPPYKAWAYLVCNELAQGVGRQMYYTDEIGETIPLSDSDEEADSDTESLDGVSRQADMFLLNQALSQYGIRSDVVRIAAGMMKVKKATVQARMQVLAATVLPAAATCTDNQKLDVLIANFTSAFCRRCRVFNCLTHTGPHTKPQQRRPDVRTSIASACPSCGPHCCKANTKFSTPDASTSQDCLAAVFNQRQAQEPAPAQLRDGLHSQLASQQSSDVAEGKQEGWEEDSAPLPMRPAPYPAGPGRAIGHSPSAKPEALLMRPAGSGPGRAVEHSPFAKAPSGASPWSCPSGHGAGTHTEAATTSPGVGAEHASSVAAAAVQAAAPVASSTTRKRQRSSLTPGPATAARAASAAAVAAAFPYTLPASDAGIQPNRQQSNQEAKEPLPVQTPSSTGHAQTHSTGVSLAFTSPGSSLPIILSDSDDDKPTPKPHSSRTQIPSLSPTPPCSHSPCPTYRIWKPPRSMVRGTNAAAVASQGSAESPIVIEISDEYDSDEDCRKTTLDHVAAAAGSGSKFTSGISQRQAARHSSAGGSKEAEGQACLLGSKAAPQPLPFNLDTKGSARLSPSSLIIQPSSVGLVPASKQPLMKGSSKHSPASSHTSSQPANASEVQESIRQAARSSALLAVPRPGRANAVPSLASDTITASPGLGQGGSPNQSLRSGHDMDAQHPDVGWTPFEVSMFDKAAEMYSGDSCRMARLVASKTCSQVHARLLKVGLPAALAGAATLTALPEGRGRFRKSGLSKRRMRSAGQAKHVVLKRLRKAKGPQETPPYQPCQCKGACKEGCPCGNEGHFCEKFCACGPECQSRYKGCICKGGCRTRACPCLASDRECDPDLCKPCKWSICRERPPGSVDCHNMKLRLRHHKRVAMGLSRVAGWGAFAQEDIKRNEFVAEYTGELINHKEADRRGKAYDRDSNTYLFDLNDDWVIDAKHRGNKMRFANHSDQPNCRVQIMMVDGDHRVAIYAAQDIPTGTELLYNYGNRFGKV